MLHVLEHAQTEKHMNSKQSREQRLNQEWIE